MIFDPADGVCPTVEELVLCDLFRNIDLRELRGACVSILRYIFLFWSMIFILSSCLFFFSGLCVNANNKQTIKPSLSRSTLNLLHAVRKKQISSLGRSFSETSSPSTPPSTPQRSISHHNNHNRTNGG